MANRDGDRDWPIFPRLCPLFLIFCCHPGDRINMLNLYIAAHRFPPIVSTPPWLLTRLTRAAILELYCDGGDDAMLRRLEVLQDKKYAGYCFEYDVSSEEDPKYYARCIRPVKQGLTKLHTRKFQHARPTICVPILLATAHPRSREPMEVSKPLPWNNCYHPTCYDLCVRIPAELRDHS
ncbi:hypothetical protein DFS33DRAFT_349753 [Desarmillaria ectypa]|nr:hypothetical protein DFS33DRAFT_349753 [Desarmillaria ectypa]